MDQSWLMGKLIMFLILGLPALGLLLYWKRLGVYSRVLYGAGCAVSLSYVLWLSSVWVMNILDERPSFAWIGGSSIPAYIFFVLPFLAAITSFALILMSFAGQKHEKALMAVISILMLILWGSTVVAPN
jgi:hypothetical protein